MVNTPDAWNPTVKAVTDTGKSCMPRWVPGCTPMHFTKNPMTYHACISMAHIKCKNPVYSALCPMLCSQALLFLRMDVCGGLARKATIENALLRNVDLFEARVWCNSPCPQEPAKAAAMGQETQREAHLASQQDVE